MDTEKKGMLQNRRESMMTTLKAAAGLAAMGAMSPIMRVVAEDAAPAQKDYEWIPSAPPCKLIEEITAADAKAGVRSFKFTTDGRTCSKSVTFDLEGDDMILKNVVYDGGCDGGTQGIGAMAEGRPAQEVSELLKGIICTLKKSGSSCPMQLAFGIQQAMRIIKGVACTGCVNAPGEICKTVAGN